MGGDALNGCIDGDSLIGCVDGDSVNPGCIGGNALKGCVDGDALNGCIGGGDLMMRVGISFRHSLLAVVVVYNAQQHIMLYCNH